jgi:HlyD family secretion protein
MKGAQTMIWLIWLPAMLAAGCGDGRGNRLQGYVEGEFVYVSSPLAGTLRTLAVERGQEVKAGDALFTLDDVPEQAAVDEAERRVAQAEADLADAGKGKRPPEIDSIQAQLQQARVQAARDEKDLGRLERLSEAGAATAQDLDHIRSSVDADHQQIARMEADLTTAQLGSRTDQITAAAQEVAARRAELAQARWNLAQKQQAAGQGGQVFDTLYRPGEWVAAGHPVVVLLPPRNVKVRVFVPEMQLGTVHLGQAVNVLVDGAASPVAGHVSFVSPQAEYTPPVIYSQENRSKLVFLIEIIFDDADAARLHPGQPVEVQLTR